MPLAIHVGRGVGIRQIRRRLPEHIGLHKPIILCKPFGSGVHREILEQLHPNKNTEIRKKKCQIEKPCENKGMSTNKSKILTNRN